MVERARGCGEERTSMNATLSARDEILKRIRAALPGEAASIAGSYSKISRNYCSIDGIGAEARLNLLLERLIDYDTEVLEVAQEAEIAGAVEQTLQLAGERHIVVAKEMPTAWLPEGFLFQADEALAYGDIEAAEAVLTTCEAAVASTGTIFLVHEGAQGRRVLTLLPDHHICVVRRDQIFGTVPEAMRAIDASLRKPVTTISGPSATSDIEMTRIRGVHGPRRLTVILYGSLGR